MNIIQIGTTYYFRLSLRSIVSNIIEYESIFFCVNMEEKRHPATTSQSMDRSNFLTFSGMYACSYYAIKYKEIGTKIVAKCVIRRRRPLGCLIGAEWLR